MAINFDALPNSGSAGPTLIEPGRYYVTIEKAEMKQGKDLNKPPYLNIMYDVVAFDGTKKGKIWDILTESDAPAVQYKIKRFITALELESLGTFELEDLIKVIMHKTIVAEIVTSEWNNQEKSTIGIFENQVFYSIEEAKSLFGEEMSVGTTDDGEEDLPWEKENSNY